jgi:hypothetical protein
MHYKKVFIAVTAIFLLLSCFSELQTRQRVPLVENIRKWITETILYFRDTSPCPYLLSDSKYPELSCFRRNRADRR